MKVGRREDRQNADEKDQYGNDGDGEQRENPRAGVK